MTLEATPVTISVVNYTANMRCTWIITGVPPIDMNFTLFDIEADYDRGLVDYVKVYKGKRTGRVLQTYSGSDLPPPLRVSAGTVTVAFTSASNGYFNPKGFVVVLRAAPGAQTRSTLCASHKLKCVACAWQHLRR